MNLLTHLKSKIIHCGAISCSDCNYFKDRLCMLKLKTNDIFARKYTFYKDKII